MKSRSSFFLVLLSGMAATLIFAGWFFQSLNYTIVDFAPFVLNVDQFSHPLFVGVVPLWILFWVIGFLFLDLIHDFFGPMATWACVSVSGFMVLTMTALVWMAGFFENEIPFLALKDSIVSGLGWKRHLALVYSASILFGFSALTILSQALRSLFKNRFSLIRLFFSKFLGFLALGLGIAFLKHFPQTADGAWMAQGLTFFIQLFVLSLVLIIPYYLLKGLIWVFVGETKEAPKKIPSKGIFNPSQDFFQSQKEVQEQRIQPSATQNLGDDKPL